MAVLSFRPLSGTTYHNHYKIAKQYPLEMFPSPVGDYLSITSYDRQERRPFRVSVPYRGLLIYNERYVYV